MPDYEQRNDRFTAVEDEYAGYTVRDPNGEKIGKVDDLFLDENDKPEYIGVKMGFFGTRSTLVPLDACTVDKSQGFIEVNQPKQTVKDAPSFDDDNEITPDYERQVREYYGLSVTEGSEDRGSYGAYAGSSDDDDDSGRVGPGMVEGDTDSGEFRGHSADNEGVNQRQGSDLEDEDELRVQRSEEELRAGVREREAGKLNVRKRVKTERETVAVPKKREEVTVDRVAVNEEASEGQIGEDEVSVPVVEEEVVVGKQAVVKEEVRVRKDVVQDEEVVEEDVRKEEVDIDDNSGTTGRRNS
ncbi:MAG: hypothetical protein AVDCRST_MAG25-3588 [uncultured Rubrobacteraceae bacterium]|uniref:DUF2382 domain-containing protein n=1 Tax=uncultured Rubrobacteraceae bacterium TaxID=349277 RepID=A0A6J4SCH9_9ACTN|nr:MAG: hypothetical protein AVDCRST_MAG25-3588 [uncultured Rubrobacteraceae bacterium]